MGLLGIFVGLAILVWLAFRGWSVLLLAPGAALVAAAFGGQPLLASWTQIFMESAARFLAQFFPLFLLGAVFGKLMEDNGSVSTVATFMTKKFGESHVMLAVVLAGAVVTYGGVSLFVAFFVLVRMAQTLFRAAAIPRRFFPAAIVLGTSTFTMSALPGAPSIQNAIPMPSLVVLPQIDSSYLAQARWGGTSISAVVGGGGAGGCGRNGGASQPRSSAAIAPEHGCGSECVSAAGGQRRQPGFRTATLDDSGRSRPERMFGLCYHSRHDLTRRRDILDQVHAFTGENDDGIYIANGRRSLVTSAFAIHCSRECALASMPVFGEIISKGATGNAIRPIVTTHNVEN